VHSTRSPYPLHQAVAKALKNPIIFFQSRSNDEQAGEGERADDKKNPQ